MHGRYRDGISEDEHKKLIGCAFSAAILAAPFIALLYSRSIGLGVLAFALGSTVYFAYAAFRESTGQIRSRMAALLVVNAMFLILVLAVLLLEMTG